MTQRPQPDLIEEVRQLYEAGEPVMMSESLTGLVWEMAEKLSFYPAEDRADVRAEINRLLARRDVN